MAFEEAALQLRHEEINKRITESSKKLDVWEMVSVRYALRVLGLRTEFYKTAAEDPVTAKMLLPGLERRLDLSAAYGIAETMEKLY